MATAFLFVSRALFAFLLLASTFAAFQLPVRADVHTRAALLFSEYYEEWLKLYPMEATAAGDHRYDDQLPNTLSESFRQRESAFYQKYLASLDELDRKQLTQEEQLSCDILRWQCETALEGLRFPTNLMPINQFSSLHLGIGQWAGGTSTQPFKTVRDYENWLRRLDAFSDWCHTAVMKMRQGMAEGYILPKVLIERTIPQMTAMTNLPATNHLYYSPIHLMPASFSATDRARLASAYSSMIESRIVPAFRELAEFLRAEYLPAGRDSSGIDAVPRGSEFYRFQVKAYTTLSDLNPDQVFSLGEREVARISLEMEKIKEQVGFEGNLNSFFESVRTRKELMPYSDPQQVLDHFSSVRKRMEPSVQRLFRLTPKTPLEIRRTEAFREASASAEWICGPLDGSRPGIFYVPIPDVKEYNVLQDEALFLHEAIPGHHYQVSLQRENQGLPMFRRTFDTSAFTEGWALYCESLGKELGLYTDPYQSLGMLSMEMHRAIRLVVDSGLHAKGWTRERAIEYSLQHEADSAAGIAPEIERYMAWPGQALAYKTGQLKIKELRASAEQALGDQFDIREFHDRVLESGPLPLRLLQEKILNWIASKSSGAPKTSSPLKKSGAE